VGRVESKVYKSSYLPRGYYKKELTKCGTGGLGTEKSGGRIFTLMKRGEKKRKKEQGYWSWVKKRRIDSTTGVNFLREKESFFPIRETHHIGEGGRN